MHSKVFVIVNNVLYSCSIEHERVLVVLAIGGKEIKKHCIVMKYERTDRGASYALYCLY